MLALGAAAALLLGACAKSTPSGGGGGSSSSPTAVQLNTLTPGTLLVGSCLAYKPFEYYQGGQLVGFDVEIMAAIADKLGLKLEWKKADFSTIFTALAAHSFDAVAAASTIKPDRLQVVDFSDPYYTIQQGLLVKKGTPIESAHTIADLKPYRFGAQTGTTGLDFIKNTIKPAKISQYNDTITAGQALSNGQIDAVVIDVPIAIPMTTQFTNLEVIGQFLTNESYAMTFVKGNPLLACVNQALAAMKADSTLKTITDKSFPGTTADIPVFK